jgi:hypothetical protein
MMICNLSQKASYKPKINYFLTPLCTIYSSKPYPAHSLSFKGRIRYFHIKIESASDKWLGQIDQLLNFTLQKRYSWRFDEILLRFLLPFKHYILLWCANVAHTITWLVLYCRLWEPLQNQITHILQILPFGTFKKSVHNDFASVKLPTSLLQYTGCH